MKKVIVRTHLYQELEVPDTWEQIGKAALGYMSEYDVADMAETEGFVDFEEEDDGQPTELEEWQSFDPDC